MQPRYKEEVDMIKEAVHTWFTSNSTLVPAQNSVVSTPQKPDM